MHQVIPATEARVHFDELLRRVTEDRETVIVERDAKPQVVFLAFAEYQRLQATQPHSDWRQALVKALAIADSIRARRGGRPLPDPSDVIRQARRERDAQLGLP